MFCQPIHSPASSVLEIRCALFPVYQCHSDTWLRPVVTQMWMTMEKLEKYLYCIHTRAHMHTHTHVMVCVFISKFHRHGHALAVAGNAVFFFGGACSISQEVTLNIIETEECSHVELCCFLFNVEHKNDTKGKVTEYITETWNLFVPIYLGGHSCLPQWLLHANRYILKWHPDHTVRYLSPKVLNDIFYLDI